MDADFQYPEPEDVAAKARSDFPTFFMYASSEEEGVMDAMILTRLALHVTSAVPRRNIEAGVRRALEKTTDGIDATFAILRDTLRACPAYSRMSENELAKLERDVLTLSFPEKL